VVGLGRGQRSPVGIQQSIQFGLLGCAQLLLFLRCRPILTQAFVQFRLPDLLANRALRRLELPGQLGHRASGSKQVDICLRNSAGYGGRVLGIADLLSDLTHPSPEDPLRRAPPPRGPTLLLRSLVQRPTDTLRVPKTTRGFIALLGARSDQTSVALYKSLCSPT